MQQKHVLLAREETSSCEGRRYLLPARQERILIVDEEIVLPVQDEASQDDCHALLCIHIK